MFKKKIEKVLLEHLELIRRTIPKQEPAFTGFVEKIRICLCFYLSLDYVCNTMGEGAKRIRALIQLKIDGKSDFFSPNQQLSLHG